jgi:hypothetical protein
MWGRRMLFYSPRALITPLIIEAKQSPGMFIITHVLIPMLMN